MTPSRKLTPWVAVLFGSGLVLSTAGCNLSSTTPQEVPLDDVAPDSATTSSALDDGAPIGTSGVGSSGGMENLLEQAKSQADSGHLRDAYETYAMAIDLDPDNAQAKVGFQTVSATLGMREGSSEEIADAAAEITEVRRAQIRIEAESRLKQGEVALNAGEFDDAIRAFEDALLIVRYNPFLEGASLTEAAIESRLTAARQASNEQDRAEEMALQARLLREQQEREDEERARAENQIITLFEAANVAFQDDRYAEAESYLTEILRVDPTNQEAAQLRNLTRDARMQATDREISRDYKRNWRRTFDDMAADLKPQMELLLFPDENQWRRIAEQGPVEFSVQDELVSAAEREILNKLSSVPMTLSFSDTSLSEAIDWFRTVTGVNFIVSPIIIDSGDEPIFSVNTNPMPAREALDLLLELSSVPLTRRVKDGVVHILSSDEAVGGQVLEIYDVRDLAKVISNFPSTEFNLKPSGFADDFFGEEGPEPAPLVLEQDRLADLIRTNIAPESWDLDPNNSINPVSGALVVRQTPNVQRLIRGLLQDLRENAGTLINVESRFLTVSDSFLEDIGVDFRGLGPDEVNPDADIPPGLVLDDFGSVPDGFGTPANPSGIGTDNDVGIFHANDDGNLSARVENLYDVTLGNDEFTNSGGLSLQATFLNDTLVEGVLRAVTKYGTANIVDAPSLTMFNGQRASLSVINNYSFVKDFDTEIAQAAVIAQPIVDVIQDGVVLDVRPVVSSDKRFVTMELRPTVAVLQQPLDTFNTSLGIGGTVTIELPTLEVQRARTTVTMPDGSTLMIGGWKVMEDENIDSGVPFLNQIPFISFLAGRKGKFTEQKKLIILVRAKILIPEELEPVFGLSR